jgi:hypothetical protein
LKKRSKKLLSIAAGGWGTWAIQVPIVPGKSFLALFFKKELLSS